MFFNLTGYCLPEYVCLAESQEIPLTLRMRAASATALGAAAARAKLLADREDREIEHLVATIIEMQVRYTFSSLCLEFYLKVFFFFLLSK